MADISAPDGLFTRADKLLSARRKRDHRLQSKVMVRNALAGVLAALLAQVTFGAGFAQLAEARSPALRSVPGVAIERAPSPASNAVRQAPSSTVPGQPEPSEALPVVLEIEATRHACSAEMVLVEGLYCTEAFQHCARWLDDETLPFARCAEYQAPSRCIGKRIKERFCIDRYEYTAPHETLPLNYASFQKASSVCQGLGKRVCTESEWNFACEGEEMRPYPYGFARQPRCNQDRGNLYEPNPHRQILADRREPAAARPECVSPFGVFNMAGNMDEPVLRDEGTHIEPFRNALKGGWWMPARNRCRPATTAHDDFYEDIQVGVRCCSDSS